MTMQLKTTTALLLALSMPTFAANATTSFTDNLIDSLAADPFVKDSTLDLSLRNYWKYLKEEETGEKRVHNAWGQGINLDYKSGYFADFIGVDVSYYTAVKLAASDYFATRALLYSDGSGFNKNNARGYNKFGQRAVKVRFSLGDVVFHGKGGWQVMRNVGAITASNQLSQNTYLGYYGNAKVNDWSVDLAYVTSSLNRDSPEKVRLLTRDGKKVDYIATTGINYQTDDLRAAYFYGQADDYLRRHGIELAYKAMPELTLGAQIYGSEALSDHKRMSSSSKEFDNNAWHYAADALWREADWGVKFGVAYTRAKKEEGVGYYGRHMTKNMRGRFMAMSSAGVDYMRDGEVVFSFMTDYKITPEFTAGLRGNYSQFDYQSVTVRSGEVTLFGLWKPSHPALKNLTIGGQIGPGWAYKNKNETPTLVDGKAQRAHSLSAEFLIDYRFNIF